LTPTNDRPILQIEDHLTDAETLNFWKRYFQEEDEGSNHDNMKINIDEFCEAIQQEFYSGIISNLLSTNEGVIDEELLI